MAYGDRPRPVLSSPERGRPGAPLWFVLVHHCNGAQPRAEINAHQSVGVFAHSFRVIYKFEFSFFFWEMWPVPLQPTH